MAPGGEKKKSKLPMIIGGCCLLIVIVSCIIGGYSMYAGKQAVDGAGGAFAAELNRVTLGITLGYIIDNCAADSSGVSTGPQFHPGVAAAMAPVACHVTPNTIAAFTDSTRSEGAVLAGSADEFHAVAQAVDPNSCYVYTSGSAKAIGCLMPEGEFQLLFLENPGSVQ